jgi:hypothetical protein
MEFEKYSKVPQNVSEALIKEAEKKKRKEK